MELPPLQESDPEAALQAALPLTQGLTGLHDSVVVIDGSQRIVWMSEALEAHCGAADRVGISWDCLFEEPEDAARVVRRLESCGRFSGEPVSLAAADGSHAPAAITAARIGRGRDSAILAIVRRAGSPHDEVEDAIANARSLLDGLPDPVLIIDRSRFVSYANPAFEKVFGYEASWVIDRPLAMLVRTGTDFERVAQALQPDSQVRNEALELKRRDRTAVWVNISTSALRLADGSDGGAVVYLRDVTEQHRAQENLARKNAELEHYVHAVSHDLRSPLVSLLGFSRLLRDDYGAALDEKGLHFLDRVEQAGRTMESLIHDLLELSRIGRSGPLTCEVDSRSVLVQLRAEVKPRLDEAGVQLTIPEDPPVLRFDRTRLYQLFSNLVGNALDHMGACQAPSIDVRIDADDGQHLISVADTGRGVPAEHRERIFEIFQSIGGKEGRRGTGIGLAIVRKIVETQEGRAWVEETPGGGATFKVALPH